MRHRILNTLGWVYLECGDLDVAVEFNRRGAEAARKRGDAETIANSELNLGDAYLAKGDLALAQEFLDGVHELVRRPTTSEWMKWRYSTHLFASLGELALARGDRDPARRFADECLEIASRTQAKRYLVKGWRLRGQIGLARGDTTEAEQSLRQALTIAQSIQNPPQLWSTHAALGELHRARGEREAAQQLMHEKAVFAPIWEIGDLHGVGPRVGDPAIGYVPGYPFSAPYEDVKLKPK
jgi:tetratricopeptide (TPR) repeat protein